MTGTELVLLSPLAALGVTPLAITLAAAIRRRHATAFALTLAGFALALFALPSAAAAAPASVGALLSLDDLSYSLMGLVIAGSAVVALMSRPYLARVSARPEEYYALLAIAAAGGSALVSTQHLAGVFIGVETMSVALYGLIAYTRERSISIEAGLKYLIMTGAASAVLLFGAALLYADTAGLSFEAIAARAAGGGFGEIGLAGLALLVSGLAFKLAVAPFHMWAADVYQGAPAPVAALVATVSKAAVVGVTFRMLAATGALEQPEPAAIVSLIAVVSMVAGNLLALLQAQVKRLLAFSSIAHLGYLLIAVIAAGTLGLQALLYYLVAYFVMVYLAFGVVTALSDREGDADAAGDFQGLCWRRPLLGLALLFSLLSLIGVPLTAGFIAKLYVLAAAASGARWGLVIALALTSAVGAFYYIRLALVAFTRPVGTERHDGRTPVETGALLAALATVLLVLGAAPLLLDPMIARAIAALP